MAERRERPHDRTGDDALKPESAWRFDKETCAMFGFSEGMAIPDDAEGSSWGLDAVDSDVATRILRLASKDSSRPWAALLARLRMPDGRGWTIHRLEACFGAGLEPSRIPVDRLYAVKEAAKLEVVNAATAEAQATAWLYYATTVAIGTGVHTLSLSTMPPAAWLDLFSDLYVLTPDPWSAVFEQAVDALKRDV